jgi:hypothetical protein
MLAVSRGSCVFSCCLDNTWEVGSVATVGGYFYMGLDTLSLSKCHMTSRSEFWRSEMRLIPYVNRSVLWREDLRLIDMSVGCGLCVLAFIQLLETWPLSLGVVQIPEFHFETRCFLSWYISIISYGESKFVRGPMSRRYMLQQCCHYFLSNPVYVWNVLQ